MARKQTRGKKGSRSDSGSETETRPKGPSAAGFTRQQGTKTFRRQRAN
jgi:hypothetical protein